MNEYVKGDNVILRAFNGTDYIPFACATGCSFTRDTEMIGATTVGNGKERAFKPRFTTTTLTLKGITYLTRTTGTYFYVLDTILTSLRNDGLQLELAFTDEAGNTQQLQFFAYVPHTSITGDVDALSDYEIDFQVSGGYTQVSTVNGGTTGGTGGTGGTTGGGTTGGTSSSNSTNVQDPINYTSTTGGETSITYAQLIARVILSVSRDGIEKEAITSGLPNDKQVKFISTTGQLVFPTGSPLGIGEWVLILYK